MGALLVLEADALPSESPCLRWVDLTRLGVARPPSELPVHLRAEPPLWGSRHIYSALHGIVTGRGPIELQECDFTLQIQSTVGRT